MDKMKRYENFKNESIIVDEELYNKLNNFI
jgi:hypothetical protein